MKMPRKLRSYGRIFQSHGIQIPDLYQRRVGIMFADHKFLNTILKDFNSARLLFGQVKMSDYLVIVYFVSSIDKTNYDAAIDSMKGSNTNWIEIALKIA